MKNHRTAIQNASSALTLDPEDFGYVMGPDGHYVMTEEGRRMWAEAEADLRKEREEWRKRNPSSDTS